MPVDEARAQDSSLFDLGRLHTPGICVTDLEVLYRGRRAIPKEAKRVRKVNWSGRV